jgi:hypothetical protein
MFGKKQILAVVLMCSSVLMMTGCETKFTVSHYPGFYNPSIKSIAVLPFENETSRKGAGIVVASHLSAALAANRTYQVTGPARIEQILKEKAKPELPKNDYKAIAQELAELDKYQAFITGTVLSDSFINTVGQSYDDDDFYYDDYPYWYYPDWYLPYMYYPYYYGYGSQAYVSANVSIIGVPDGTVLDTTAVKAAADARDISESLKKYAGQLALNDLSEKIVRNFAIVPVEISVYPDKAMKIADSLSQDKWHFTKTIGSDRELMYVVLCLPAAAAMNQFQLTITPQNNPSIVIVSKDLTWERDKYCQGVEFSPRQIGLSNGPGKYSAHFISRGKVVMTRNFRIK